jgi:hypothetical protein
MLGIFGIFGRSQEMQRFDQALRGAGLNPRLVSDAVKITTLKQLKQASRGAPPDLRACTMAAELLSYCVLGRQEFLNSKGEVETEVVEARLMTAIEDGQGLDARLVILALHAGLVHPSVVERFNLGVE